MPYYGSTIGEAYAAYERDVDRALRERERREAAWREMMRTMLSLQEAERARQFAAEQQARLAEQQARSIELQADLALRNQLAQLEAQQAAVEAEQKARLGLLPTQIYANAQTSIMSDRITTPEALYAYLPPGWPEENPELFEHLLVLLREHVAESEPVVSSLLAQAQHRFQALKNDPAQVPTIMADLKRFEPRAGELIAFDPEKRQFVRSPGLPDLDRFDRIIESWRTRRTIRLPPPPPPAPAPVQPPQPEKPGLFRKVRDLLQLGWLALTTRPGPGEGRAAVAAALVPYAGISSQALAPRTAACPSLMSAEGIAERAAMERLMTAAGMSPDEIRQAVEQRFPEPVERLGPPWPVPVEPVPAVPGPIPVQTAPFVPVPAPAPEALTNPPVPPLVATNLPAPVIQTNVPTTTNPPPWLPPGLSNTVYRRMLEAYRDTHPYRTVTRQRAGQHMRTWLTGTTNLPPGLFGPRPTLR